VTVIKIKSLGKASSDYLVLPFPRFLDGAFIVRKFYFPIPKLALICLVALLAACGGGGGSGGGSKTDTSTDTQTTASAACALGSSTIGDCKI